jgi:hypothetical protein
MFLLRPSVLMMVLAIVGFVAWGIKGSIIGLAAGYALAFLLGQMLIMAEDGILPKEVRKITAKAFIDKHSDYVSARMPPKYSGNSQRFVEDLLERLYKRAAIVGPSSSSGYSQLEAEVALESIKEEEQDRKIVEVFDALWAFLVESWYDNK